jgi:hypothetical protein
MFFCRKPWVFLAVGCVFATGWLALEISNTKLNAQVNNRNEPKSADALAGVAAATLQSRVEQLEQEMQAMKRSGFFSGLSQTRENASKPDPIEIDILRKLVTSRTETWQKIYSLKSYGAKGGDAVSETQARFQLYMALARLAWAERQDKETLEHLRQARIVAQRQVEAVSAAYDTGVMGIAGLFVAQQDLADANLLYYHAGGKLPDVKLVYPWAPPGELPQPSLNEEEREPESSPPGSMPMPPTMPPTPAAPPLPDPNAP